MNERALGLSVQLGLLRDGPAAVLRKPRQIFQLHGHAGIFRKGICVPNQVVPIQGGNGAGLVSGRLRWVISAAFAVVAHAVDVFPTCYIGLAGHQATVGELAHAKRVGKFHP